MKRFIPAAVFLLALSLAPPALATLFVRVTDADLADQAAVIAEVRVLAVDPSPGTERPATEYLVAVERLVKGLLAGDSAVLRVPGGLLGDGSRAHLFGAPEFGAGERALVFLEPRSDGTFAVVQLVQGAFHVVELKGREIAMRDFEGAVEVELPGRRAPADGPRDLGLFRRWLADRAAGEMRPPDYFVALPADRAPEGADKFTLIEHRGIPVRWRQFDSGGRVRFQAHRDGQPGLAGGGFAEFRTGLRAWNDHPGSAIDLRYAGTTTATAGFGTADGSNVILFDDPNDELGSSFSCAQGGTLAATQVRFGSPQHNFDGRTFWTLYEADIITNRGAACWLRLPKRAEGVFGHELGHAIGLGHSCGDPRSGPCNTAAKDEALMRASAHSDNRGARLNSDDRAGIAFLYSAEAGPPGRPTGLSATALGPGLVELQWRDNSGNESEFQIDRLREGGGGSFERIATVERDATRYQDPRVSSGFTYTYRVRARNGAGASVWSNQASAATPGELAPTELRATALSTSEIELAWRDNALSEGGYQVEGAAAEAFELLASLPANAVAATISGLEPGTTYRFRVRSVGGVGPSSYSGEAVATTACLAGPGTLCLNGGRFAVAVEWRDFEGDTGTASVVPADADDSGLLWFFDPDNWEMLVKVVDGCGFNGRFWVFAAATTNVEYSLRVTDTATSATAIYFNELGVSAPAITDIDALDVCGGAPAAAGGGDRIRSTSEFLVGQRALGRSGTRAGKQGGCVPGEDTLCLSGGRFQVEVAWRDFEGETGSARVVKAVDSDDSGLLWFFDADNWEMLVKVIDACVEPFNSFWVFSAAVTNVGYTLRVTDTLTGDFQEYENPLGVSAPALTDTETFETCP